MSEKIGVLGCGWLGLPLAKSLLEDKHTVYGTTTSDSKLESLRNADITPFKIELTANGIEGNIEKFLCELDLLIINVPPKLRSAPKESYIEKMLYLHGKIKNSPLRQIIFISSTSVYGNHNELITEDTAAIPTTESGRQLLASENIFLKDDSLDTKIIRFGGLIGPKRHPITHLAGKTNLTNGNDPVNLIHLNDCIGIIKAVINGELKNQLLNGVYPHHPRKEEYYTSEALKKGLLTPLYTPNITETSNKTIESKYINVKTYLFITSIVS